MKLIRLHILLLSLFSLLPYVRAALQEDIPDDVEVIEFDVSKMRGMPGVKEIKNVDDAYAYMDAERQAEEAKRTQKRMPEEIIQPNEPRIKFEPESTATQQSKQKAGRSSQSKAKGKDKKRKIMEGEAKKVKGGEKDWRNEL